MIFELTAITDKYVAKEPVVFLLMGVDGVIASKKIPLTKFNSRDECINALTDAVMWLATECYSKNNTEGKIENEI